jgi:hypothetical protein
MLPLSTHLISHWSIPLRGPEDQKKKTGRPEDTRPIIHGLRGPEDRGEED